MTLPNAGARKYWLDYVVLAAVAAVGTFLLIGNIDVRLANTSGDDGLVTYGYLFRYPERFAQDAQLGNWGYGAMFATMLNWLPAMLFKYADVDPEVLYHAFIYAQNVLLATAVFHYALIAVESRPVAWLSALFTLTFRPHWWNIGMFADLDWMPYANWFALPFLVYAGSLALQDRHRSASLLLLVGGLVHPVLGLCTALMLGTYWALAFLAARERGAAPARFLSLGIAVAGFVIPAWIVRSGFQEAPIGEILPMILRNGHTIPWNNPACHYCMPLLTRGTIVIATLSAIGLIAARRGMTSDRLHGFLWACLLAVIGAVVLHVVGYLTGNLTILRLVAFRASILLLIFVVPPAIAFAWRQFRSGGLLPRLVGGYFMALPSPAAALALLLVSLPDRGQLAADAIRGWFAGLCGAVGAVLFAWILARHVPSVAPWVESNITSAFLDPAYIPLYFSYHSFGYRFPELTDYIAWWVCFAAVTAWAAARLRKVMPRVPDIPATPASWALAIPLVVFLVAYNRESGTLATEGAARQYYEVQAWARSMTSPTTAFIVGVVAEYDGWRNYTHRPRIVPSSICGFYMCTVAALERDRKIAAFWTQHGNLTYPDYDSKVLKAFAGSFGGEFVVRRKSWKPLELPVAFENDGYVVYDLR